MYLRPNIERLERFSKHLQTQQDEQGNVVHASLHPLLQRHCATAVSINRGHHVLQNLIKRHQIVTFQLARTFLWLQNRQHVCRNTSCMGIGRFHSCGEAYHHLSNLANELLVSTAIHWQRACANKCVYLYSHCFKVKLGQDLVVLVAFISEQKFRGLTGLSSDTSQPR